MGAAAKENNSDCPSDWESGATTGTVNTATGETVDYWQIDDTNCFYYYYGMSISGCADLGTFTC